MFANKFGDASGTQDYVRAMLDLVGDRDPLVILPDDIVHTRQLERIRAAVA